MKSERVIWIVVILLIGSFFGFREWKNGQETKGLQTMIEVLNDSVRVHKNSQGQWEAERKSFNLTTDELRKHGEGLDIDNKALKKRVRSLSALVSNLRGDLEATGSGEVQLIRDTVYLDSGMSEILTSFKWNNKYLSLDGTLSESNNLKFNYSYTSGFEVTTYWKKNKGMFKGKDLVVNFTMEDPNAYATNLNSVVIKPDPPKFYETTVFKVAAGFLGGMFISGLAN